MGHSRVRLLRSGPQVFAESTCSLVDMHSHLGDAPSPGLDGAEDDNSVKGPIVPWMRSLDGLNTHDEAFHLSISGGVTTSLILPGSANAIGSYHLITTRSHLNPRGHRWPGIPHQTSHHI